MSSYSFNKINRKGTDWGVDTSNYEFIKSSDLEIGNVYEIYGVFFHNKGKFGESGVLILDGKLVDLPKHMNDNMKELLNNDEFISDVKAGKVGIKVYTYDTEIRQDCIGFDLVMID